MQAGTHRACGVGWWTGPGGRETRMLVALLLLSAAASAASKVEPAPDSSVQSMLDEESADVLLAKATLQQCLSRVVRRDWDAARRLTHPKTMGVIAQMKKRSGVERHNLAPWANRGSELKTFQFAGSRQVAPGMVLIEVGEDTYRSEEQGMSVDDPAVYLLFKSRGGFLVVDQKADVELSEVSANSVKIGYPGYLDAQVQAQARREPGLHLGRSHR